MIKLIPIEYRALALVVALGLFGGGMYWWGGNNARNACAAKNGTTRARIEAREDKRDANIDAIASATSAAVAAELIKNKGTTDEAIEQIRTVYVRPECRTVDADIVRELRQARDDANATLGISLRPTPATATAADIR